MARAPQELPDRLGNRHDLLRDRVRQRGLGALGGWSEPLYRTWYLTGAVWTAAWLGLGTALLLSKTRFGYAYAALVVLGGLIAFAARSRYPDAGTVPLLVLIGALVLAAAIAIETYFQNERWPAIATLGVVVASVIAAFFAFTSPLVGGAGVTLDPRTAIPTGDAIPGPERIISLSLNIPGGLALALGALFSAYIFMPKKRVLDYSLDPASRLSTSSSTPSWRSSPFR